MKKIPLKINSSSFNFTIAGPIGKKDGILISSTNARNNLVGFTSLVYSSGDPFSFESHEDIPSKNYSKILQRLSSAKELSNYFYIWSKKISSPIITNHEDRAFRILFCTDSVNRRKSQFILGEIEKHFQENAFGIYSTIFNDKISEMERANEVAWLLSPIVFLGEMSE